MDKMLVTRKDAFRVYTNSKILIKRIAYCKYLYLFFLPALLIYIIFSYVPMYGAILAFKDLNFTKGILGSPWTSMHGMKHFYDLLSNMDFRKSFVNTMIISIGRIVFEFPVPVIIALLINEIRKSRLKRVVQTVFTFPHFVSWVIISGIFFNLLSDSGVVNEIIAACGGQKINLLSQPSTFRVLLFATDNWKEAGWSTIIYLATISGINPSLYEAAIVDGANRFQLVRYITWPAIKSVIGVMFILSISRLMNAGFDQIFNLYNPAVYDKADIIDTYIYRRTFMLGLDFATSTAVGLFKSVINVIMLIVGNAVISKATGKGIY